MHAWASRSIEVESVNPNARFEPGRLAISGVIQSKPLSRITHDPVGLGTRALRSKILADDSINPNTR